MWRWYILPIRTYDDGNTTYRWPKYFRIIPPVDGAPMDGVPVPYALMDYGLINAAIVVADVTQEQHDEIVANSDAVSPPQDIDTYLTTGAIPTVQNVLEALRIPAGWVTTDYTYREILRMVAGLFQFAQRYDGMHHEDLIPNQAALNLQWNQIPAGRRTRVQETVADLGYDTTGITGTTTVRQILWIFAQQWGDSPFYLGGQTL